VYWAKVTQQLTLSRRYSQLVANRCCRLACSLLETPFVTRDVLCSENLFVNRVVRDERRSWTEFPLYTNNVPLHYNTSVAVNDSTFFTKDFQNPNWLSPSCVCKLQPNATLYKKIFASRSCSHPHHETSIHLIEHQSKKEKQTNTAYRS
jgi:hypothetical protein